MWHPPLVFQQHACIVEERRGQTADTKFYYTKQQTDLPFGCYTGASELVCMRGSNAAMLYAKGSRVLRVSFIDSKQTAMQDAGCRCTTREKIRHTPTAADRPTQDLTRHTLPATVFFGKRARLPMMARTASKKLERYAKQVVVSFSSDQRVGARGRTARMNCSAERSNRRPKKKRVCFSHSRPSPARP